MPNTQIKPDNYIVPLNINSLEGRLLRYPNKNKRTSEILFVYGRHASLERWWALIQVLHSLGTVSAPDLPGYGGMDSFYKINKKPSLDNMAEYLATFIKMQYKKRSFVIVSVGYGFSVVTRMLQKYPELLDQVKMNVSLMGYADKEDLKINLLARIGLYIYTGIFKRRISSFLAKHLFLNRVILKQYYLIGKKDFYNDKLSQLVNIEAELWKLNDFRTYVYSTLEMLKFTNCHQEVKIPVYHVYALDDHRFINANIEQHLKVIYKDYYPYPIKSANKAIQYATARRSVSVLIPSQLKQEIRNLS